MKIPRPFIPLRAESENGTHTVHIIDRDYTVGIDGMLTSLRSQGVELLAAPMRVVAIEDGEAANWNRDYAQNESESFIQSRSDEQITLCGAMQSDRFVLDLCYKALPKSGRGKWGFVRGQALPTARTQGRHAYPTKFCRFRPTRTRG